MPNLAKFFTKIQKVVVPLLQKSFVKAINFIIGPHFTRNDIKKFIGHLVNVIPEYLNINLKVAVP
jgi:hypothetical protein